MRDWILARVRRQLQAVGVGLAFGGGQYDGSHDGRVGTLVVRDIRTLLGLIVHPDLYFGEAYMQGRLEVRGDLEEVIEALTQSIPDRSLMDRLRLWVSASNGLLGARRNVEHHYDLGNDFYSWWLDEELVYSCAFFEQPDMTLEQAQCAKMELVSRKLQLRPGETFPGGYPPTLAQLATQVLEPARRSVIDIENLRLHYARTVGHWAERFAAVRPRVLERYGEEFRRAWALYLAVSESALGQGDMQLFQVLFSPMRAAHPYRARAVIYERPLATP